MEAGSPDNVVRLDEALDTEDSVATMRAPALLRAVAASQALPPFLSARDRLLRWQWEFLGGLILLCLIGAIFAPAPMTMVLKVGFWIVFSLTVIWRLALTIIGVLEKARKIVSGGCRRGCKGELPVYSLLIALRHEDNMMEQLARNLRAIDWPGDRLDILLLIEEDDAATLSAAEAARFPAGTRCLTVPPGLPLTKPRALNYGLACAQGEYVAVYDAEDRPHPRQLKSAYSRFCEGPASLKCVQAPLVASNGEAGWLPAQWTLEYGVQFGLHVPALASLDLPVMLGGTSNHFRRADLLEGGGWDAWNVTEDADLGLRIARLGGTTATIAERTHETAPERSTVWLNQRSRWIKGYIQTWLVCMRAPVRLVLELGFLRWLSLQLTLVGTILSAFLYGPMSLMILLGMIFPRFANHPVDIALFMCGWAGCALADLLAPGKWTLWRIIAIATRPLYWPLQTLAGVRAVGGLALRPFFWAKTPHMPEEPVEEELCPTGSCPSL
jgi:cellulose synthase/poly-beta-1,6-N-acetylglucosamine synthase-like glycosyltransferase